MNDAKIINDPVFGFIRIPRGLLYDIVKHPLFQRLTRISQLGLASVVYPGARHTRFQHSLGAYHLMGEALLTLQQKGQFIFDSEAEAVQAAILMHDIGHGPFSHVLEHTLISGISHEDISLMMMEQINRDLHEQLSLAISIFRDTYTKRFLHQLISSQLDMDRLDYLRRDAFFTGVAEGTIGSARIIKMLNVVDDRLVVEQKGIYSLENYLTSRRLMYWQVYLHKTTVAYEKMLVSTLRRAKYLAQCQPSLLTSHLSLSLAYFLYNDVDTQCFHGDPEALRMYGELDDSDIWSVMKAWRHSSDKILARLAGDLLDRRLWCCEMTSEPPTPERLEALRQHLAETLDVSIDDTDYLMQVVSAEKDMYSPTEDSIDILMRDGTIADITQASELLTSLSPQSIGKVRRYYLCYSKST